MSRGKGPERQESPGMPGRIKKAAGMPAGQNGERKKIGGRMPSAGQLEAELEREKRKEGRLAMLRSTLCMLVTAAAAAVLIAGGIFPILRIYGSSMLPALEEGNIVVCVKTAKPEAGDVIAFYYNDKILVKRVICSSGDRIEIEENGIVRIHGEVLEEPYVDGAALGRCDITFPYQVPEGSFFVMGDHRLTSVDSRSGMIGCVAPEQIIGIVRFRIWPLKRLGAVD